MGWFSRGASKAAGALLGEGTVDPGVAAHRLAICKTCPSYTGHETCALCHCHMPTKVHYRRIRGPRGVHSNVCPVGKW